MSAKLWSVGTANAFNTTLNGNVLVGDATIALTSVTGLQAPGVLVVDRQDVVSGADTPTKREYISFTGISGSTVTGAARGLGTSTAQAHSSGAKVEEVFTITHWNDLISALLNVLTSAGALDTTKAVDLATAQTLTNKNLTSPTITGTVTGGVIVTGANTFSGKNTFTATVPTIASYSPGAGGTATLDLNTGNIHTINMPAGNITIALSNPTTNQPFVIRILQDSVGSRTVTWFTTIKWAGGTAPTLTTTLSKTDVFGFICTSTGNYDGYVIGQNL